MGTAEQVATGNFTRHGQKNRPFAFGKPIGPRPHPRPLHRAKPHIPRHTPRHNRSGTRMNTRCSPVFSSAIRRATPPGHPHPPGMAHAAHPRAHEPLSYLPITRAWSSPLLIPPPARQIANLTGPQFTSSIKPIGLQMLVRVPEIPGKYRQSARLVLLFGPEPSITSTITARYKMQSKTHTKMECKMDRNIQNGIQNAMQNAMRFVCQPITNNQ